MKRVRGAYGIFMLLAVLLGVVAVTMFFFNSSQFEGFRSLDCKGVTCEEGQFCQDNVCKNIEAPITNKYFPDSTA